MKIVLWPVKVLQVLRPLVSGGMAWFAAYYGPMLAAPDTEWFWLLIPWFLGVLAGLDLLVVARTWRP
jgi:hypothetical protein